MTKQTHTPADTKSVNGEIKTVYLPGAALAAKYNIPVAKVTAILDKRDAALKMLANVEQDLYNVFEGPMRKAGKLDGMYLVPSLRFGRDAYSFFRAIGVRTAKTNGMTASKANALSVLD